MSKLSELREVFWPLLESIEPQEITKIKQRDLKLQDADLDLALSLAKDSYSDEEKRLSQIESKSIVFIGSFSVAISIILAVANSLLSKTPSFNLMSVLTACILIVTVIYLCRVLWFSIKALSRGTYHRLGHTDFIDDKGSEVSYKKELIILFVNCTANNSRTINEKVDCMVMAQEYFKRSVISILIFTILLASYSMFSSSKLFTLLKSAFAFIKSRDFWFWISIVLFVCLVICLILLIKTRGALKNKKG